jgi:uncharacterized protein YciI
VPYFLVKTVHGPNWDETRGIREQVDWDAHAEFMDALVDDGFVILGGPIGDDQHAAMLAIEAADEHEIEARFEDDPWSPTGVLELGSIERWTIWLDGTGRIAPVGSD